MLSSARARRPWLPLVLLAGLLGIIPTARSSAAPGVDSAAADTVAVFGPRRFAARGGQPALHVERFRASPTATPYLLRVENAPGDARPSRVAVSLNGAVLFSASAQREPLLEIPVLLQAENTLEVTVQGSGGAVLVSVVAAADGSVAVLQPRRFERGRGSPVVETARFTVPAGAGAPYRLYVVNGEADGSRRVSSAVVRLNGTTVITPSDLNPQVGGLVRGVVLAGANVAEVEVRSAPGSFLTLWVTAMDTAPPLLQPETPAAGLVTREMEVDASGRVVDLSPTRVTVNGVPATVTGDGFRARVPLAAEGENVLLYSAVDAGGLRTDSVRTVIRDTGAPRLVIDAPAEGIVVRDSVVRVTGTVHDATRVTANVNGIPAPLDEAGAFAVDVPLPADGAHFLTLAATDQAGNSASLLRGIVRDTDPPAVAFAAPAAGTVTRDGRIQVSGTVRDASPVRLTVNGAELPVVDGAFHGTVPLDGEGARTLAAVATDAAGNEGCAELRIVRDTTPPEITVQDPRDGFITRLAQIDVTGAVADSTAVVLTLNGAPAVLGADGGFRAAADLAAEGTNVLELVATDAAGNVSRAARSVVRDTEAPVVAILAPAAGALTRELAVTVAGTVQDRTAVTVRVNGVAANVDAAGAFAASVPLDAEGTNPLAVVAVDAAGNEGLAEAGIVRDTQAPAIVLASPADGLATRDSVAAVAGRVDDASPVALTLNGAPLATGEGNAFQTLAALAEGSNPFVLAAVDAAGNTSSVAVSVVRERTPTGPALPADPATVAPRVSRTVATTVDRAAEFLYTGENPIQTGVEAGAIQPVRATVLRGRVLTAALEPLGGVTVSVRNQPELGQTLTRADGAYDLVVNGGGLLSVDFARDGYLPAQRRVDAPWQTYTRVEDVVLLQPDATATVIDLSSPEPQVARGSVQTDADGPRQPTLLIAPGTGATLRLPDGTTQPLPALTVRATEFTVGDNGPRAMPGPLPATTMYTYAVALTADEAMRAGGEVTLSRPAPFYVENFLGFPVGTQVPVGVWDAAVGAWVPEPDGRVVRIVEIVGGAARVDVDGDGTADSGAEAGMEPWELQELARTYAPGTELWRAPVTSLRIRDLNMPGQVLGTDPSVPQPSCASGDPRTLLECRAQVNVQSLPLAGTSFALVYASDRVPGRAQSLNVQLTPDSISPDLKRVELEITVAGRTFRETFQPAPDLRYAFDWDGLDAYGRRLQGTQPATVRVGHVYPVVYQIPARMARSFGLSCAGDTRPGYDRCVLPTTANSRARQEATRWQTIHTGIGAWDADAQGVGGWNLSPHHAYDPMTRTLYQGDGSSRHAAGMAPVRERMGHPAFRGYSLRAPVAEPDGGVLVAVSPRLYYENAVYRITPAGDTIRLAGNGSRLFTGYGGPATQAGVVALEIARGPDGSIYINDWVNFRVHRVAPDGTLQPFAGTGTNCTASQFSTCGGDGGPATEAATMAGPLAVGPDGSVYLAGGLRVRRVGPDGIIQTIAGVGSGYQVRDCSLHYYRTLNCGDGGLAVDAMVNPSAIAVGPDGRVYIGDGVRVRRIDPDGVIRGIAGDPTRYGSEIGIGDGGPATEAQLGTVRGLAVAPDGSLYIATDYGTYSRKLVWRLTPDGLIRIVAGHHPASRMDAMTGIALGADGSIFVSEYPSARVTRIGLPLPGAVDAWRNRSGNNAAGPLTIASGNGSQLYRFDAEGRHEATLDAVTGVAILSFAYGADGQLESVTDANGLVTRLERNASGTAVAVVGPYRDRTELAAGADGSLGSVAGPDGHAVRMAYGDGGLLTGRTDANGATTSYAYDADGRMVGQTGPDGSSFALSRTDAGAGEQVQGTLPSGAGAGFRIEPLAAGGMRQTAILPSGAEVVSVVTTDGKTVTTGVDGTVVTTSETPDPRFGMQAPLRDETVRLPSGLTRTTSSQRTVTLADPANPASLSRQVDRLTVNGRTSTETYERAASRVTRVSAGGRQSVMVMDAQGRPVQQQVAGLTAVANTYDAQGRVTRVTQGARSQSYTYDVSGRVASTTDASGRTQRYTYDAAGRVLTQTLPDERVITFTYDRAGNLLSVTPPTRPAHVFGYTAANLSERYTAPDAGQGPAVTRMVYDQDQRVREIIRPDGGRVQMQYDSAGRRTGMLLPEGALTYAYDPATGKLISALSADGVQLGYSYDGSLLTEVRWSGALSGTLRNGYDADFRIAAQRVNGDSIGYRYDGDGLLTGVGGLTLTRSTHNGLLIGTSLGTVASTVTYNTFGERSGISVTSAGAPLFQTRYTRDDGGRITAITETASGATAAYAYRYDDAGRLVEVTRDGAVVEAYEYDANGNRVRAVTANGVVTATVDAQDRLLAYGDARFTYAANGEIREKVVGSDTTRYAYDALGNLQEVVLPDGTRIEYVIDAENRRVGKVVNGAAVQGFLYQDALNPIAELDASGAVVARFIYGEAMNVPEYMVRGGTTYRIVADHLGSVRMVVDAATGEVVQRIDYDSWGNVIRDSNPGFQPFGYAGGVYDAQTALVRFGARDYDARTARWTAKDPILFEGGDANLYGYTAQDPINYTDARGTMYDGASQNAAMSTSGILGNIAAGGFYGCMTSLISVTSNYGTACLRGAVVGMSSVGLSIRVFNGAKFFQLSDEVVVNVIIGCMGGLIGAANASIRPDYASDKHAAALAFAFGGGCAGGLVGGGIAATQISKNPAVASIMGAMAARNIELVLALAGSM